MFFRGVFYFSLEYNNSYKHGKHEISMDWSREGVGKKMLVAGLASLITAAGCLGFNEYQKHFNKEEFRKNEEKYKKIGLIWKVSGISSGVLFWLGVSLVLPHGYEASSFSYPRDYYIRRGECPECEGKGERDYYDHSYGSGGWDKCGECKGTGKILDPSRYEHELHEEDSA